ncbi:unnamed protein product [Arabidopsis thaliana]|uniref:(thale cress) hypothetical protein n=1 Tax=Arabidopsis thaliana TaxID=3702 RepID=A0A7G2DYZ9_ARATH|nr:unnamed protein product [Arabidopsis thaliana]
MTVIPMLSVNTNEDGWGEWDDEVRDKKVFYLIEQISKCHNFTKKEWPGGYADLPLIYVNEKEPVVQTVYSSSVQETTHPNKPLHSLSISCQHWCRGDKHHNSPFTTINVIGRGVNVSMHAGDETVSENSDNIVDDKLWKKISMETCKDSVCSPQKHLDETPSVILPKFISANSTELPPSDQPIYDTESKSRDEHLPSPRPPAVFDTATKPPPNDVTEEIKSSDLSLAENVDTLLDTVCKNISFSVAASDEIDLFPTLDKINFKDFIDTLWKEPHKEHITRGDIVISHRFLLQLAQPTNWVDTMHIEVLGSFLNERHKLTLSKERAVIIKPWLGNYLQGKYRSFQSAKNKLRVQWNNQFKRTIPGSPSVWLKKLTSSCLQSGNNTAKYIEGLRLAALVGPSVQAPNMLGEAAIHYLHSYFAFAVNCAEQVTTQIQDMAPTGQQLYQGYRILNSIPDCHLLHFESLDVCPECFVLTYLFKIRVLC